MDVTREALVTAGFILAALAVGAGCEWWAWRRRRRRVVERLTGRQQIRRGFREEAAKAIAGAPVSRRLRRQAVAELQQRARSR